MSVDKLVDSAKLDACCTAEANAIRAKTGGSSQLAYDWANSEGFADAIAAIPTGITPSGTKQISITQNGTTIEDVAAYASAEISVSVPSDGNAIARQILNGTIIEYIDDTITTFRTRFAISSCPNLERVICHNVTGSFNSAFQSSPKLKAVAFPKCTFGGYKFQGNYTLETIDIGTTTVLSTNFFNNCRKLTTLVLRQTSLVALADLLVFINTPFQNNGYGGVVGGTIYIPKALYDHLGDGTSSDYKAATNWSTVDGYGTITWAKIEGSIYETQYADGTPIPTN